jgi:hypothetical protein
VDEAYLYLVHCKDKEWIHGETSYKLRSRCAHVWMDDGMITPLCDPSLPYFIFLLDMATPFLFSSFFWIILLGMPFFFFGIATSLIFFKNTWREIT